MRSFSFTVVLGWLLCIDTNASGAILERRASAYCDDKTIKTITSILSQYSSTASKLCSTVLKRGPSPTTVVTSTESIVVFSTSTAFTTSVETSVIDSTLYSTVTATTTLHTTVTDGVVRETLISGATTIGTTTLLTLTSTRPDTVSRTTAIFVSASPVATTSTVTQVTTTTRTSTITSYTNTLSPSPAPEAPAKARREENLGQKYPGCPKALSSVILSLATKACDCFLPVSTVTSSTRILITATSVIETTIGTTSTIEITNLATSTKTVTESVTSVVVVPSTRSIFTPTTTVVSASTSTRYVLTGPQETTISATVTLPAQTFTSFTTTRSTVETVTTTTRRARATYALYRQDFLPACYYYRYYVVTNIRGGPRTAGIESCAQGCSGDGNCRFFFYAEFANSVEARCVYDSAPGDGTELTCRDGNWKYSVGYNKGQVVVG